MLSIEIAMMKVINKAIASVKGDTYFGLLFSLAAALDIAASIVIFFLVLVRVYSNQSVDYGFLWFNIITFVLSVAYLTRKVKNVPDNH